jgi:hypothetical protein
MLHFVFNKTAKPRRAMAIIRAEEPELEIGVIQAPLPKRIPLKSKTKGKQEVRFFRARKELKLSPSAETLTALPPDICPNNTPAIRKVS